jgi:4-amino-4-deoxy-L-arabinose transferase-like glycosyltransferase
MSLAARLFAPAERLVLALTDPARRERTAIGVLVAYVVLWMLYGVLAKASQDIHFDMAELVAWSREPALGYPKHPPLAAWVVRAWFTVFPVADWSYYLLAMTAVAVGLWLAWRLFAEYIDSEKRVLGLALLTLLPFYSFHALKFNPNTLLIPLWAATTLCFLRSFERRSVLWAALAGVCAAASMLGKYWSVFLLAGLALAALIDPRRRVYFRSAAPWVTMAVGAVVLAPHLVWLVHQRFAPFSYAVAGHARTFTTAAYSVFGYLGGAIGYVAVAVGLALAAMRPNRAAVHDILWPERPQRRLAAVAFWAPLLLPAVLAPLTSIEITSLWTMSAWTLLPVVLLSSPLVTISRQALLAIVTVALAFPIVMVAAAPAISLAIHKSGVTPAAAHSRLLAERVAHEWRQVTNRPLRIVGGNAELAYGVAFYLPDRPTTFPDFDRRTAPWVELARLPLDGIAIVCFASDPTCPVAAGAQRLEGRRTEVEIARSHFGVAGRPERYVIVTVPPRR